MKTLRTIVLILAIFMGGNTFISCKDSKIPKTEQGTTSETKSETTDENSTTPEDSKQVMDNISDIAAHIETLSKEAESNTSNITKISKDISELKGLSNLLDLISWGIAAMALVVSIIALIKLNSLKKHASKNRDEVEELEHRIYILEQKHASAPLRAHFVKSGIESSEYSSLISRISYIERKLDKMSVKSPMTRPKEVPQDSTLDTQRNTSEQTGFFGLPSQKSLTEAYFKRLTDTRESDSYFKVIVQDNKAEFKIIEGTQYLNEIKSNDDIKMALELEGCAPTEATQMNIILPGQAQKDGERWIITKKAIIALIR